MLKKAIKKLTEYCDKGESQRNFVSFTVGMIISIIMIIIRTISVYIN